jgi:cell division protein FtsB
MNGDDVNTTIDALKTRVDTLEWYLTAAKAVVAGLAVLGLTGAGVFAYIHNQVSTLKQQVSTLNDTVTKVKQDVVQLPDELTQTRKDQVRLIEDAGKLQKEAIDKHFSDNDFLVKARSGLVQEDRDYYIQFDNTVACPPPPHIRHLARWATLGLKPARSPLRKRQPG